MKPQRLLAAVSALLALAAAAVTTPALWPASPWAARALLALAAALAAFASALVRGGAEPRGRVEPAPPLTAQAPEPSAPAESLEPRTEAPELEGLRSGARESREKAAWALRRLRFADAVLRKVTVKTEEAAFALMQRLIALRQQSETAATTATSTETKVSDSDTINGLAVSARSTMRRVRTALEQMRKHDKQSSAKLKALGQELKSGIELLAGIEEITERSRLIAFNMAIEAARIGEKGRGFKVIVGELRSLNDRTIGFSKQVAEMLTHFKEYNESLVETSLASSELVAKEVEQGIGEEELAIESLLRASTACVDLSDDVSMTVRQMNVELDGVLESLQFQDITRQMIEGALATMAEAEADMAPLRERGGMSHEDMDEEKRLTEELRSILLARAKTRGEKEAIQEVPR